MYIRSDGCVIRKTVKRIILLEFKTDIGYILWKRRQLYTKKILRILTKGPDILSLETLRDNGIGTGVPGKLS